MQSCAIKQDINSLIETDSLIIYLIHFLVNSLSIGNTRLMYFSHDNQKQVIVKWQQYSVGVSHFANILIHLKSHFLINIALS